MPQKRFSEDLDFTSIDPAISVEDITTVLESDGNFRVNKTHQDIHNELIRHDDFVLVGRGIYALNEWGLPSGTVCDLIKSVLEENGGPMKRQEIITAVLKKRDIRIGTISLNLQKYPFFKRVGRAVYGYETTLDNRKRNK